MNSGTLDALRVLRDQLQKVPPYPWSGVELWISAARPLFRTELQDHLPDFERQCKEPLWSQPVFVASEDIYGVRSDNFAEATASSERSDRANAAEQHAKILAFIDGLIAVVERKLGTPPPGDGVHRVRQLIDGFENICRALARRSHGREALLMADEYDVQYLFGALLKGVFLDVRAEEPTPSRGGGGARMDFLVKAERLVVELKMIRDGLNDREVTDQLLVDIARYEAHPDCGALVCFVYDPAFKLKNPRGIEVDLSRRRGDRDVHVFVRPF